MTVYTSNYVMSVSGGWIAVAVVAAASAGEAGSQRPGSEANRALAALCRNKDKHGRGKKKTEKSPERFHCY